MAKNANRDRKEEFLRSAVVAKNDSSAVDHNVLILQ